MRFPTLPAVGILSLCTAVAVAGCQAAAPEQASHSTAAITIATIPLGDDPTQANPIEAFADLLEAETGRTVEVTDVCRTISALWKPSVATTWTSES